MTASPTTPQIFSAVDNKTGLPLAGGQLFTYQSGTNTYQAAYSDSALTEPLANPILLDNYGQSVFYLNPALSYRFNLLNTGGTQQAHYPQDNIVMAISANTSNVWSQLQTFNGGAVAEGVELGAPGPGGLSVSATGGLIIQGTAGSAYDLTVKNNAGTPILSVPIGGAEPYFPIGVQGMTVGVGSVSVTGATGTAGQMFYESQNGLAVQAKTGSVNDFMLLQPTGTTDVMRVPTGTQNLVVEGQVSSAQFNGSGAGLTGLPGVIQGLRKSLQASTTGSSAVTTITADGLILTSVSGLAVKGTALTLTNTLTAGVGAGGLDAGSPGYSQWYYIWAIYNPNTTTFSTVASTSSTAPVLPSGYTFSALVSVVRTQAATNYYPLKMQQWGNLIQYGIGGNVANLAALNIATGVLGTGNSAWGTASIAGLVPPNAESYKLVLRDYNDGSTFQSVAAPSTAYGATYDAAPAHVLAFATASYSTGMFEFGYEANSVALQLNNTNCTAGILGYRINL